jgi:nickel-dependent lactate racemase
VRVCGLGLHRTTTGEEKTSLAGRTTASRVAVADAQGLQQVSVFLNQTRGGAPAFMNLQLARADLVVAVGVVEPHLYAGFSGGANTVAMGCAGERTIAWTHDPRFLDRPSVELGRPEETRSRRSCASSER